MTTSERNGGLLNGKGRSFGRIACYGILGATVLLLVAPIRGVAQDRSSAINLLDPKNGGQVIVATKDEWLQTIDGKESAVELTSNDSAVFAFEGERPAVFDTFAVLIPGMGGNMKEFELLAGDSPAGEFTSIGKFTTTNSKFFKNPYQEFKFPPVTAKYFKIQPLSSWYRPQFRRVGDPDKFVLYEIRLFGRLKQ